MRWIFFTLLMVNVAFFVWKGLVVVPDAVGPQAGASPSVLAGEGLVLLSEVVEVEELSPLSVVENKELLPLAAPIEEEGEPLCTLVGPFSKLITAENLVENLRALEVEASLQDVEVSEGSGYWVYLAPEVSRKAALQRLHELQAKKIDSYVIPKGELANGISFGMFSREKLALARKEVMIKEGYDAKIHEIKRSHHEVWVMLQAGELAKVDETVWLRLQKQEPDLEKRQNFCLGVASEEKFL